MALLFPQVILPRVDDSRDWPRELTVSLQRIFRDVTYAVNNRLPRPVTATCASGSTSSAITLDPAEPSAAYRIVLTPAFNAGSVWVTSKTATGFTINNATATPSGGSTMDCLIVRDVTA